MNNDLISKKDLLNALKQTITDKNPLYHTIYALIDSAYTYEQPQGEWIDYRNDDLKISDYRCSCCGYWFDDKARFCINCGSKMLNSDIEKI